MKAVAAAAVMVMLAGAASAQTLDDLKNPDNVLTYGMGYSLNRYSPLKQIDKATVNTSWSMNALLGCTVKTLKAGAVRLA